ncbi:hypothetical protein O181_064159 [Austropuccinia psidii MF-1]|uniref:Uncharacterized protein n=1 Tax=Austropuccinia psidii MF-1 TaxID=1389203 RepID=A0A9Q3ENI6_9BASI|nr:hypothetical protein [Austropuccinia psidii MF-1]
MDWVTGVVPGGKEKFNSCLIIVDRFSKSKIIKGRKIRLNGKDQRQYLVHFKIQTAEKDKWLAEDSIPDGNLHLRRLGSSRRTEQSHQ